MNNDGLSLRVMTFAQRLKHGRAQANLTQEELAERAGYSISLVRKLEGGQRHANARTAQHLAAALKLNADERAALLAAIHAESTEAVPIPGALPVPPTLLIGREPLVAELLALLQRHHGRLLTLLGPPGVGKTRLALAAATAVRQRFVDGAWWVPLAPLQNPNLLMSTILRLIGGTLNGIVAPHDQLAAQIGTRSLLLLLDNCEHLLPAIGLPLATLLERCPRLVILATSRMPLHVRAEQRYQVAPLTLPAINHRSIAIGSTAQASVRMDETPDPKPIADAPAVQLFVERAAAIRPGFALTAHNAATIAAIATRLDGLPLAIELAAAQIDTLTPNQLLMRLKQRFVLLNNGPYDLLEHQRTLQTSIGWSYDLLDPDARAAFVQLGVFVGGWTWDAAQAFGCATWLEPLAHAGLVVAETTRWALLETLRAFALERLEAEAGLAQAQRTHAHFFCTLAEQAEEGLLLSEQGRWLDLIDADLDNIRAALTWSLGNDIELALRISSALYIYWSIRSITDEGLMWMQQAIARARILPDPVAECWLAKALQWAGYMYFTIGDRESARNDLLEAITIFERHSPGLEYAAALNTLGLVQRMRGRLREAQALHLDALAIFERAGAAHGIARVMVNLGLVKMNLGHPADAYRQLGEAAARWQRLGNTDREANASVLQAIAANLIGRHDEAITLASRARRIHQMHRNVSGIVECERVIGQVYWYLGERRQAFNHLQAAVRNIQAHVGINSQTVAECEYFSEIALTEGDGARAVSWLAACESWRTHAKIPTHPDMRTRYQQELAAVRDRIGEERWHRAWEDGARLSIERMIEEMLKAEQ